MQMTQIGTAVACVLIPCFFMGVTFPLLCNTFLDVRGSDRFPSVLYAWNTLGACTGVLACQFILLPLVGHGSLYWLMALVNILLGSYFLIVGGDPVKASAGSAPDEAPPDSADKGTSQSMLLACATLSGLLAGALEGDTFKRVEFVIQVTPGAAMTFISFWAILGIILASITVHRCRWLGLYDIKLAFVGSLVYYGSTARPRTMDAIQAWVQANVLPVPAPDPLPFLYSAGVTFPSNLTQLLIFIGIVVFPTFYLISLLLPYVCNRTQGNRRHIGMTYGLNTVAFCAGLIGFTLIAPRVNIFYSVKLFLVLFVVCVVQLCFISETRRFHRWKPVLLAVAFMIACFVVPTRFDRSVFHPLSPSVKYPVTSVKSDGNFTTHVVSEIDENEKTIYFGRLSMSATRFEAQVYMRLLAHFPLLAQDNPRHALLICFGVGNTASAIAVHDTIDHIDIVDLNDKVFESASEFDKWNRQVYKDERVRLIHDDGRHFLDITDGKYDIVTSEPPPPMAAGVYRLYSQEYYESVLDHLTPTGMMSQWLPIYQMPRESIELAIRTFINVFPNALLISGWGNDFILVGSPSEINLATIEARFYQSDQVLLDLEQAETQNVIALLGRIVDSDRGLRIKYAEGRIISDQHNDLEQLLMTPEPMDGLAFDPVSVLEDLQLDDLAIGPKLRETMLHFGRLRHRVPGFPFESMANQQRRESDNISLSDADWITIRRLYNAFQDAHNAGDIETSVEKLQDVLVLSRYSADG